MRGVRGYPDQSRRANAKNRARSLGGGGRNPVAEKSEINFGNLIIVLCATSSTKDTYVLE